MIGILGWVYISAFLLFISIGQRASAEWSCPREIPCKCFEERALSGEKLEKVIDCNGYNLSVIPSFLLLGGQVIKRISLRNNQLSRINGNSFTALTVKSIDMSENQIQTVSDNTFKGLNGLEELRMRSCNLGAVPSALKILRSLKLLDLHKNKITNIRTRTFLPLTELEHLDFGYNLVQFAGPFTAFSHLTKLRYLNLENCDLFNYPVDALNSANNLTTLILRDNKIQVIPEQPFAHLGKLQVLDLENNPISFTNNGNGIADLRHLRVLKLGRCKLEKLGFELLEKLTDLTNLTVRYCGVKVIDSGLFNRHFPRLKSLDIGGNDVELNEALFAGVFGTVQHIGLSGWKLSSIPIPILKKFSKLRRIDLDDNNITTIAEGTFYNFPFSGLTLDLSDNKISFLTKNTFDGLKRPVTLYLRRNKISSLKFITDHPCLWRDSYLDLSGNPVICNCHVLQVAHGRALTMKGNCTGKDGFEGIDLIWEINASSGRNMDRDYAFERNRTTKCVGTQLMSKKYECSCKKWIPLNSTLICASTSVISNSFMFYLIWASVILRIE